MCDPQETTRVINSTQVVCLEHRRGTFSDRTVLFDITCPCYFPEGSVSAKLPLSDRADVGCNLLGCVPQAQHNVKHNVDV